MNYLGAPPRIDGKQVALVDFVMSTDPIKVDTLLAEVDPMWVEKDAAGHWHYVLRSETPRFPTMDWVDEYPGDPEYLGLGWWVCKECRARVQPATRMAKPMLIPGPVEFKVAVVRGAWQTEFGFPQINSQHILTLTDGSIPVTLVAFDDLAVRLSG